MSTQIANFATCVGVYDGSTLGGTAVTLDTYGPSVPSGPSDLSLNSGYLQNTNAFVMPSAVAGQGISFTGWFFPAGQQASNSTPIFDASLVNSQHIALCVSGGDIPILAGNYIGNTVYSANAVNLNSWNFFAYTICCSGNTQQLFQKLFLNGVLTLSSVGTYAPSTFATTLIGYGSGAYANYFQGKIDDFRYYGRCITVMEMRVLYSYAYGQGTGGTVAPTLGQGSPVTVGTLTATTVPLLIDATGTYSYIQFSRFTGGAYKNFIVSPAALVPSGNVYMWTDTDISFTLTNVAATYVMTPFILGTPGPSMTLTATVPLPNAITNVLVYNAGIGVFDVSWLPTLSSGGAGIVNSYTYDVSMNGAILTPPATYYTTTGLGQGGTANPTRFTMLNTAAATYSVMVKATNGIGTVTSAWSNTITTTNPTTVSATGATKLATGLGTTIYRFTTATATAGTTTGTLSISGGNALAMTVLAIAGGGSGGSGDAAGGGGAGGLIATSYTITGNNTLTISVGAGGPRTTWVSNMVTSPNGTNTTVTFSTPPGGYGNLTCNGGGGGGRGAGGNGGSGGGSYSGTAGTALGTNNNIGFNAGTSGLPAAGGGGAGGVGGNGGGSNGGAGGVGYQSTITGTNLYWGGGGGGCAWNAAGGNGGLGGGGGGGRPGGGAYFSTGGGSALNSGTGAASNAAGGGDAGANTGGGGGGFADNSTGGSGGSGIVIVSFTTAAYLL